MIEILYEDRDIVVVVKPAGMPSQQDRSGDDDLYTTLKKQLAVESLGLVQRLDRPVGGIVVLAKSDVAAKGLTAMVKARKIDKFYLALVDGQAKEKDHLEHWLQQVRGNRSIISNRKVGGSKAAVLDYERLSVSEAEGDVQSLLRVKLETGRHHQIRAQLAHMKLPLVGDTKYNPKYQKKRGWFDIGLYAYELAFEHPVTGEVLRFHRMPEKPPFGQSCV